MSAWWRPCGTRADTRRSPPTSTTPRRPRRGRQREKSQRLPRQHRVVHRRDLVRQWFNDGCVDSEHRVEKVRQLDPLGFGDEAEESAVAIEGPGKSPLDYLQARLVVLVEKASADRARPRRLVRELDGGVPKPLDVDDLDRRVWRDSPYERAGCQVL